MGDMVPLATLVDIESISGPEYTNRFNFIVLLKSQEPPHKAILPLRLWRLWKKSLEKFYLPI
jgi:hypothetical protein